MNPTRPIPQNWSIAELGELGSWSGGGTPSKANASFWTDGTIPWVSAKDMKRFVISDSIDRITEDAVRGSAAKMIAPGSVLFVMRSGILAHTFPVAHTTAPVTVNQDLRALTPAAGVLPEYVAYGVRASASEILRTMSKDGTTVASVDATMLAGFRLPLAPTAEQRRVVEAIESYLTRLDGAECLIARAKRDLERYRASVLRAAVEGRLVPTEAELASAEGRDFESATALLTKLTAYRRASGSGVVNRTRPAPKRGPIAAEGSLGTRESTDVEDSDLPAGWASAAASTVCDAVVSGSTPAAGELFAGRGPIPFIKVYNLTFTGRLDFSVNPTFVRLDTHEGQLRRSRVVPGDVLTNIVGPPFGKVSVVPVDRAVWNINQAIAAFRPSLAVSSGWLRVSLMSQPAQRWLLGTAKTTTNQINLAISACRRLPLRIPPFAEQARIVAEVDRHMSLVDAATRGLELQQERLERLRQSVLRWAFEGLLVDQDPTDEPASTLLARIRAERDASATKSAKPRARRKPKPSTP